MRCDDLMLCGHAYCMWTGLVGTMFWMSCMNEYTYEKGMALWGGSRRYRFRLDWEGNLVVGIECFISALFWRYIYFSYHSALILPYNMSALKCPSTLENLSEAYLNLLRVVSHCWLANARCEVGVKMGCERSRWIVHHSSRPIFTPALLQYPVSFIQSCENTKTSKGSGWHDTRPFQRGIDVLCIMGWSTRCTSMIEVLNRRIWLKFSDVSNL